MSGEGKPKKLRKVTTPLPEYVYDVNSRKALNKHSKVINNLMARIERLESRND